MLSTSVDVGMCRNDITSILGFLWIFGERLHAAAGLLQR